MIITIANLKGGVGKSTLTASIAAYLSYHDNIFQVPSGCSNKSQVLLIDADGHQTSTQVWADDRSVMQPDLPEIHCENYTKQNPGSYINRMTEACNHIVIDTPCGNPMLMTNVCKVSDVCVIPWSPSSVDLRTALDTIEALQFALHSNPKLQPVVLINKASNNPKVTKAKQARELLHEECSEWLINEDIHLREAWDDSFALGLGIHEFTNQKATNEFMFLLRKIREVYSD